MSANGQYVATVNGVPIGLPAGFVAEGIIIWAGTIANIPSGYIICDGNNGTPDLLTKFVEGVATAATNPGATGGATLKELNSTSEDTATTIMYGHLIQGGHVRSGTDGMPLDIGRSTTISDIRPSYYDVAFLMKT